MLIIHDFEQLSVVNGPRSVDCLSHTTKYNSVDHHQCSVIFTMTKQFSVINC